MRASWPNRAARVRDLPGRVRSPVRPKALQCRDIRDESGRDGHLVRRPKRHRTIAKSAGQGPGAREYPQVMAAVMDLLPDRCLGVFPKARNAVTFGFG